jgi:hypothetical protein
VLVLAAVIGGPASPSHPHLGAKRVPGADRSTRDLFRAQHARVEARLVTLVGDEVEDFLGRALDRKLALYAWHRSAGP